MTKRRRGWTHEEFDEDAKVARLLSPQVLYQSPHLVHLHSHPRLHNDSSNYNTFTVHPIVSL